MGLDVSKDIQDKAKVHNFDKETFEEGENEYKLSLEFLHTVLILILSCSFRQLKPAFGWFSANLLRTDCSVMGM